ncbi:MAG TPA: nickel pincer cofactor biosynthesis protein LarC [Candidatus Hydrogenedentes bacterium]|nr:nickel pincer cofactor biosynthesis protein LarC [Candidatus Hydrogenedentota bacterium]HOT49409.1 nickel pincer cofactor biosynthesis protein LarC [Candidatus Hydrogenedentota bacterium]HOV74420.1 nickel pincer cofactor biosynthesis protein LarC [Candidatus Hydrogenedentota bacterium]HPC16678.1 nickel pincer cofactor biosynthesis protein LarC [Candidatus Hydrogenedentota bacterium]HRT21994.1 nickel pincer cofactor biosynthesis protein LarC [Candidatus Hydrogenedentota bacterium]
MKILYFDCACGASGDMIVGALLDAGVDMASLRIALESLKAPGLSVSADRVKKHGIMATQFRVHVPHEHAHRHLADIAAIIGDSALPDPVKRGSIETFERIARCEADIHGTTVEKIHFHEVGAIDSIADIVGAHWAMHALAVERVVASPLNLGSGTVEMAHGSLPVPAPATAALLRGVPCYGSEVPGELVTPTGAALITQFAHLYGPVPAMRIVSSGYGAGSRDMPGRANVLRVLVGESSDAPKAEWPDAEYITVIEANIDDMTPELLPPLVANVLEKGARDAFLTPILGKKGRPAYLVTILCDEEKVPEVVPAIFYASTTFGVRIRQERRICLEREFRLVRTPWGTVQVKIGRHGKTITSLSPEYEDCRRLAEANGVSVLAVYELAHAAAIKGDFGNA